MNDLIIWIPKEKRRYTYVCELGGVECDRELEINKTHINETGVCVQCYHMLFTSEFYNGCEVATESLRSPTNLGLWI